MRLIDVNTVQDAAETLWALLSEREEHQNISHKIMPDWQSHVQFIADRPYFAWYLIDVDCMRVGAIYLTYEREVGLFIFRAERGKGYGSQALARLKQKHPGPLLANINPRNIKAIKFWEGQGFKPLQLTYEWNAQF